MTCETNTKKLSENVTVSKYILKLLIFASGLSARYLAGRGGADDAG